MNMHIDMLQRRVEEGQKELLAALQQQFLYDLGNRTQRAVGFWPSTVTIQAFTVGDQDMNLVAVNGEGSEALPFGDIDPYDCDRGGEWFELTMRRGSFYDGELITFDVPSSGVTVEDDGSVTVEFGTLDRYGVSLSETAERLADQLDVDPKARFRFSDSPSRFEGLVTNLLGVVECYVEMRATANMSVQPDGSLLMKHVGVGAHWNRLEPVGRLEGKGRAKTASALTQLGMSRRAAFTSIDDGAIPSGVDIRDVQAVIDAYNSGTPHTVAVAVVALLDAHPDVKSVSLTGSRTLSVAGVGRTFHVNPFTWSDPFGLGGHTLPLQRLSEGERDPRKVADVLAGLASLRSDSDLPGVYRLPDSSDFAGSLCEVIVGEDPAGSVVVRFLPDGYTIDELSEIDAEVRDTFEVTTVPMDDILRAEELG